MSGAVLALIDFVLVGLAVTIARYHIGLAWALWAIGVGFGVASIAHLSGSH